MNRRLKKLLAGLFTACLAAVWLPLCPLTSYAAEAKISFSDPVVMVGNEVNVSMKITSTSGEPLGSADVMLSYDSNVLEFVSGTNANGGAGSIHVIGNLDSANTTTFKFTLKFKTLQPGDGKVTVSTQEVYDVNLQPVSVPKIGNSTVRVKPLATYSNDANLASLKISPGTLTPKFSASVTEYEASVGSDVSKITVSAGTSNANAKKVISGNTDLKEGENQVVCKVTAEDGQTVKKYTITVTKGGAGESTPEETAMEAAAVGDLTAKVGERTYGVATSFDAGLLPGGFLVDSVTYQGRPVAAGICNGLTILYLVPEEGAGSFFLYDEASDAFQQFVQLSASARTVIPVPKAADVQVPEGLVENPNPIQGLDLDVQSWIWNGAAAEGTEADCVILYGMNEEGEKNFYRYDQKEQTLQRFFRDGAIGVDAKEHAALQQKYDDLSKNYKIRMAIVVVLLVISVILFAMVVVLLVKKGGRAEDEESGRFERQREKQKRRDIRQTEKKDVKAGYLTEGVGEEEEEGFEDFDAYYDEPEEDSFDEPAAYHVGGADYGSGIGAVRKLTREPEAAPKMQSGRPAGSEEAAATLEPTDDFEVVEDLEDLEGRPPQELVAEAQENQDKRNDDEEDDFEFLDLN